MTKSSPLLEKSKCPWLCEYAVLHLSTLHFKEGECEESVWHALKWGTVLSQCRMICKRFSSHSLANMLTRHASAIRRICGILTDFQTPHKPTFIKDWIFKDQSDCFYCRQLQPFNNVPFRYGRVVLLIFLHIKTALDFHRPHFIRFTVPSDQLLHPITKQIWAHQEPADAYLTDKWQWCDTLHRLQIHV